MMSRKTVPMKLSCGDGHWFPVALLDMTQDQESCPGDFDLFQDQGVRGCVIPDAKAPGCFDEIWL